MGDYVSPELLEAANSTKTEAEVRALYKARAEAWAAHKAHMALERADFTDDERFDWEVKRVRLWSAAVSAGARFLNAAGAA